MLFRLGSHLQLLEAVIPQAFEVLAQLGEPLGACAIEALCAGAALGDQAGDLEHAQVLRHTGPRDREMLGDAAGGHLGAGDDPQDVAPRRITESFHEVVHGPIVSIGLRKCQVTSDGYPASTTGTLLSARRLCPPTPLVSAAGESGLPIARQR